MDLAEFDYELPRELIAQEPGERGASRLLVLRRGTGVIEHRTFADLTEYLHAGDLLVLNDTRVSARRLKAYRDNGRATELLLLRPVGETRWDALVRPARPARLNTILKVVDERGQTVEARVVGETPEGGRTIEVESGSIRDAMADWGEIPLPPYIRSALSREHEERYQTVYARAVGSAAAPTAGLHFTPELLRRIGEIGVKRAEVTLHVGVGTFRPVREPNVEDHVMHSESVTVSTEASAVVNETRGRVIAVGTTSARALETAARSAVFGRVAAYSGETDLFITPGYHFRAIDALVTNFHLPRSTLLMLVCAFAGADAVLAAYREAVRERYGFFSFGDAMLLI